MTTLQQAIDHYTMVSDSFKYTEPKCECAKDYKRLANWLKELQSARKTLGLIRSALNETSACADCTLNDRIKQMMNGGEA